MGKGQSKVSVFLPAELLVYQEENERTKVLLEAVTAAFSLSLSILRRPEIERCGRRWKEWWWKGATGGEKKVTEKSVAEGGLQKKQRGEWKKQNNYEDEEKEDEGEGA